MPDLLAALPAALGALAAVLPAVLAVAGGGGEALPEGELDPNTVTPGPVGFIATFALVVVVVLLLRDFSRRVRRLKLRGEAQEREEAQQREEAARALREGRAPERPPHDDGTAPGGGAREGG